MHLKDILYSVENHIEKAFALNSGWNFEYSCWIAENPEASVACSLLLLLYRALREGNNFLLIFILVI